MSETHALANGDTARYWEGAREGKLLLQRCRACSTVQFPPRHQCATCWSDEIDWIASSGRGTVESFSIVRRAPVPAYRDRTPYVVAAVLVEEGPRLVTHIIGDGALDVQIGDSVRVDFADDGAGNVLPQFRL